jgi:glutathione S-transferase
MDYALELVDIIAGDQLKPDYLKISPLNKVPVAVIDGQPLSENAAILTYIARSVAGTAILPDANSDPWLLAQAQSGLSFCGGTLHPQMRGLMAPQRITAGDQLDAVREKSTEMLHKSFAYAHKRMEQNGWWLGSWSIIDVYLNWAFGVSLRCGFDGAPYPALMELPGRLKQDKPSFCRMLEIDEECAARLGW